jgi:hypothetical protein
VGDVRFGSKADICGAAGHVRFTPDSDRESVFSRKAMSALHLKADMCGAPAHVCFGPKADSCGAAKGSLFALIVSCMRHSTIGRNGFSEPPSVYRRRLRQCQHRARHFHLSNLRPRHALRRALLLLSWASNQQRCEHKLRNAQISFGLSRY